MAINAYTGLMGSGKSYEVVASVIVPSIAAGRNVVTNIRGLNQELIYQYLDAKSKKRTSSKYGTIRLVKNDEIISDDFFPQFVDEKFVLSESTIVQPGDIVCIDEAWRPWGTDSKCIKTHMSFFREHRQCVDASGNSCDLVIITQDITDIHKLLKNVIELSFLFTKLKTLGMARRYRVEVYEGSKLYKTKLTSWSTQTYKKAIFPLYKSYANDSGQGSEKVIDSRQNFLKSGAFLVPLVLAVVLIGAGVFGLKKFFDPSRFSKDGGVVPVVSEVSSDPVSAAVAQPVSQSLPVNNSVGGSVPVGADLFSIAGVIRIRGDEWAVLNGPDGLFIVSPSMVRSRGVSAMTIDEHKARPGYLIR